MIENLGLRYPVEQVGFYTERPSKEDSFNTGHGV